ncbi:hypothetical protein DFH08DRAFT_618040, partial [Mycena albidolilacea]
CATCLGTHESFSKCRSRTLWNGAAARCYRDEHGKLTNPNGVNICLDFQRDRGCRGQPRPRHFHECS